MNDFAFLGQVHQALARAAEASADLAHRTHLQQLAAEAYLRTRACSRRRAEVVFDLHSAPGFIALGTPGAVEVAPHPGLAGLEYGWQIMLRGVAAGSVLDAESLLEARAARPGNSLRNALQAAAQWLEPRAPQLATAFRRPVIVVSADGRLRHDPTAGPIVHLQAF